MKEKIQIETFLISYIKKNISNIYLYIKENTTLVVIFFSIFGGLVQFFQLALISPAFVRYFSVSQIIPDALFFLLCITIYLTFIVFTFSFLFIIFGDFYFNNPIDSKKLLKLRVFLNKTKVNLFTLLVFMIATLYYLMGYMMIKKVGFRVLSKTEFIITTAVILVTIFVFHYFHLITKRKYMNVYFMINFFLLMILFLNFLSVTLSFADTNFIPNNSLNFERLIKKVEKENSSKNISIAYFNDKYVFIRISNSKANNSTKNEKIEVFKLDDVISIKP